MNHSLGLFFLCLVLASGNSLANGWPEDLVSTTESLGVHGVPRTIETFNGSATEGNPIESLEFYKSGVLKRRIRSDGNKGDRVKVGRKGNVVEVIRTSELAGSRSTSETYTLLKVDDEGRPTAIKSEFTSADQKIRTVWASGVRIVKYGQMGELYEEYAKEGDQFVGPNRTTVERDPNGRKISVCYASSEDFKCKSDSQSTTQYGPHGITRYAVGLAEVVYQYENGVVVLKTEKERRNLEEITWSSKETKYSGYAFDECGNWTMRTTDSADGIAVESRKFTYYTNCTK